MNPIEFGSCSYRKNPHNVINRSGQLNVLQWNVVTDQNVFVITAICGLKLSQTEMRVIRLMLTFHERQPFASICSYNSNLHYFL